MKIQCPCGAKYAFDVTPEMLRQPITFVCSQCGVDSSAIVNQIIRESLGAPAPASPVAVPAPAKAPHQAAPRPAIRISTPQTHAAPTAAPVPAAPTPAAALRVASAKPAAAAAHPAEAGSDGPKPCLKHLGQMAHEHCVVCGKPICPKCMEMFGYVCSAFCKGKAEEKRVYVPVYAGQKSVAEARYWRKSGLIFGSIILSVMAVVGLVSYYKWFLSVPSVSFSVKMPDKAYSGSCRIIGENQVVFLHGGLLARHDMKAKKEVWSRRLIDREKIARDAEKALQEEIADRKKALDEGILINSPPPTVDELRESLLRRAERSLSLYVSDDYLWLRTPEKLVKYDWQTGQPGKEIALEEDRFFNVEQRGDELLFFTSFNSGSEKAGRRINLKTGDVESESKPDPALASAATNAPAAFNTAKALAALPVAVGGKVAPTKRTSGTGEKPLDPDAIAAAAQNLSRPARIALPAVLANNRSQAQLLAAMDELDGVSRRPGAKAKEPEFENWYVLDGAETIELSVKLVEKKIVTRQAMKAPPKKSVLDGDVRVTQSLELANEMFNEWQRDLTGGVELEDASRYSVRLKRGGAEWTGETIGYPSFFPLKSFDVLVPPKRIVVFDKQAKKLWDAPLSHDIRASLWRGPDDKPSPYGAGPLVEKGNILYVVDEGMLSAFDAGTGNARWRLPSVGVLGLHFDDKGMIYVNTTTASPEKLRYSQQIDISAKTHNTILKVEGSTGKTLWSAPNEGLVSYMSGKFMYTVDSYEGDDMEGNPMAGIPGATTPAHVRIKRLNPRNGHVMWEHYQRRSPIDIQIDKNTIQFLFRTEMQVLKYFTL